MSSVNPLDGTGAKVLAMQAGNSITREQLQMDVSFGEATMQYITGTTASALILKTLPSCSEDWQSTSSRHFHNSSGFASLMPGVELLTPARALVHFGEPLIMEKLPMHSDTQEWALGLPDLVHALCLIFLIRKTRNEPN